MKTPQELKKILDRFPKEKVELTIHKVALGLVDDIQNLVDDIEGDVKEAGKLRKLLDKESDAAYVAVEKVKKMIPEVKDYIPNLKGWAPDIKALKTKIKSAAADLGVKPDDIKNYDLLDIVQDMALEEAAEVTNSVKEASDFKN
tara:strand:+ start:716 stop:1147 length:432 start_codon:yes stop_codon:yes gene_type:complete